MKPYERKGIGAWRTGGGKYEARTILGAFASSSHESQEEEDDEEEEEEEEEELSGEPVSQL